MKMAEALTFSNPSEELAYLKMLVNGRPADPFNMKLMPRETGNPAGIEAIKESFYLKHGSNREEVEVVTMTKYKLK